jgi:hypothetical protein
MLKPKTKKKREEWKKETNSVNSARACINKLIRGRKTNIFTNATECGKVKSATKRE